MPRNNGIYNPPPSTWYPAVDDNPMSPADWNNLLADMGAALTQSVSKDGQTTMTGALPMGNQRIINLGAATGNNDALRRAAIAKGPDIASAATITIPGEGSLFTVTGTTGINTVTMPYDGKFAFLRFADVVVLTNSASLVLPSGRNYTTKAGDILLFIAIGGSNVQVFAGGAGSGFEIGDYLDTVRTPDGTWLRRNGAIYLASQYPELASYFPALPSGLYWEPMQDPSITIPTFSKLCPLSDGRVAALYRTGNALTIQISADYEVFDDAATISTGRSRMDFVEYGNGVLIALSGFAQNGDPAPNSAGFYSLDGGETWSPSSFPADAPPCGLAYFGGLFVAFCPTKGGAYTSIDGVSWTFRAVSGISANDLQGSDSTVGVLGGTLYMLNPNSFQKSIKTIDGVNFTASTNTTPASAEGMISDGQVLIRFGSGGNIETASDIDGPWDKKTVPTTSKIYSIRHDGINYCAVGSNITLLSGNRDVWTSTGGGDGATTLAADPNNPGRFLSNADAGTSEGEISLSAQFRVPNDNPTNGWIKAL